MRRCGWERCCCRVVLKRVGLQPCLTFCFTHDVWISDSFYMSYWFVLHELFQGSLFLAWLVWLTFVLAAEYLGYYGFILVLLETPSGFAIFSMDGVHLYLPEAIDVLALSFLPWLLLCIRAPAIVFFCLNIVVLSLQNIWANFTEESKAKKVSIPFLVSLFLFLVYHQFCSCDLASFMTNKLTEVHPWVANWAWSQFHFNLAWCSKICFM